MTKYIRFYITLGGDAGWRFTNGDEWLSIKYILLFDAKHWSMESIKSALDKIDDAIYHDKYHGSTLDEKGDCGAKHLNEFIAKHKGTIFTMEYKYPWGCEQTLPNIEDIQTNQIIDWNLNGENRNY